MRPRPGRTSPATCQAFMGCRPVGRERQDAGHTARSCFVWPKPRSGQLVEEEIDGGYAAFPGNDEVSSSVSWSLAWTARYPLDPPAIARHIGLGDRLVLEVRVGCLDHARDPIDLVTAAVDAVV